MVKQSFARDDYFKALNLAQDPFHDGFSENTFFTTAELQHRLDLVKHLLEFGQQILLVKGAPGVGKTVFLRQLMVKADAEWIICRIDASAVVDPDTLVKAMSQEYLDDMEHTADTIVMLNRYLEFCNLNHKVPVLFIDEAEKLNQVSLRFVFQLMEFKEQETFIRVVLVGEDPFLQRLNGVAGEFSNTGLVHTISIPAFSSEETKAYLRYRIMACGGREDMFSEKESSRIHKISGGLAGNINFLARQGLSDPAEPGVVTTASNAQDKSTRNARQLGKLMLASLLVTVIIFVLWVFLAEDSKTDTKSISVNLPPEPPTAILDVAHEAEQSNSPALPDAWLDVQSTAETIPESIQPVAEASPGEDVKLSDINLEKQDQDVPRTMLTPSSVAVRPQLETRTLSTTSKTEPRIGNIRGVDWLLAQSGDRYVLQLIGALEIETIKRFLEQSQLDQQQLALYTTLKSGKDWHVLVYGLYVDSEKARAAITTLSTKVRAEKPWPKAMKAIQEAIESPQSL